MAENVTVKCVDCGIEFEVGLKVYKKYTTGCKKDSGHVWRCRNCVFKSASTARSEGQKKRWIGLTTEQKKENMKAFLKGKDEYYKDFDKEDFGRRVSEGKSNMSDEAKANQKQNISNALKKFWENIPEEERKEMMKVQHEKSKEWWANLSEEERQQRLDYVHNANHSWWENMDDDEKEKRNDELNKSLRKYWGNISDKEITERIIKIRNKQKEWWNNLTDEKKNEINEKRSSTMRNKSIDELIQIKENHKKAWELKSDEFKESYRQRLIDRWKNMSISEKAKSINKSLRGNKRSSLNNKFEIMFYDKLDMFYLIAEYTVIINDNFHNWDYAVFNENGELEMLIDLDGEYFHGDICDYDGLHSKLKYDLNRYNTIPENTKWCIIYENKFEECFKLMMEYLSLSYEEFITRTFQYMRCLPCPYPSFNDQELNRSYDQLCKLDPFDKYHINQSIDIHEGDRIIQHFHKFYLITVTFKTMEYRWNDDEWLLNTIKDHNIIHNHLNKNKILQHYSIFLSPAKIKTLIMKYLPNVAEIFNPFHSLSNILLACTATSKRYIGVTKNDEIYNETLSLINFFNFENVSIENEYSNREYESMICIINNKKSIKTNMKIFKCKKYLFIYQNMEEGYPFINFEATLIDDKGNILVEDK